MRKITLITMEYPPFNGGVGNYYFNLVNQLKNNFDIQVFCNSNCENFGQKIPAVNYVQLLNNNGPIKWLKLVFIIIRLLKQDKKQLFWVGNILPIGSACWLAKIFFKLDYFVSLHGLDWQTASSTKRKSWLANKILTSAKFITVNSKATASLLPEKYKDKISVIYPAVCIDTKENNLDYLKLYDLQPQKYFLSVGRLVERKGQKQSILAWSKVIHNHPDFKLVIAGSGSLLVELQDLINELKLNDNVVLINNANNKQIATLYQNAFCFLFPVQPLVNDLEGFGIVCIEAQNYGLPVITTATGGVVEAVNESAVLLNTGSVEEIFTSVDDVITKPDLHQTLVKNSLENAKKFSWINSGEKLSATIKQYE